MTKKQAIGKPTTTSKNSVWLEQIERLKDYCKRKKWTVDFTTAKTSAEEDMAWPSEKRLLIRKDRKPEITLYYFLHEIGHMLICTDDKKYDEAYGHCDDYKPSSLIYRVGEVEEE